MLFFPHQFSMIIFYCFLSTKNIVIIDNDRGRRGGLSLATTSPGLPSHQEEEEDKECKRAMVAELIEKKQSITEGKFSPVRTASPVHKEPPKKIGPSKERMAEICGNYVNYF